MSCEREFQPELLGRPVVVLSNNDGCVIARSNEAKALKIAMGAPWHPHRDRFTDAGVIVRSSNYTLYGDMSGRVMSVLSRFTPDLEIYSIDEAFLRLQGFGPRLESHARALRAAVLQWTRIPVSVGIAPGWRGAASIKAIFDGLDEPEPRYRYNQLVFPRARVQECVVAESASAVFFHPP